MCFLPTHNTAPLTPYIRGTAPKTALSTSNINSPSTNNIAVYQLLAELYAKDYNFCYCRKDITTINKILDLLQVGVASGLLDQFEADKIIAVSIRQTRTKGKVVKKKENHHIMENFMLELAYYLKDERGMSFAEEGINSIYSEISKKLGSFGYVVNPGNVRKMCKKAKDFKQKLKPLH